MTALNQDEKKERERDRDRETSVGSTLMTFDANIPSDAHGRASPSTLKRFSYLVHTPQSHTNTFSHLVLQFQSLRDTVLHVCTFLHSDWCSGGWPCLGRFAVVAGRFTF